MGKKWTLVAIELLVTVGRYKTRNIATLVKINSVEKQQYWDRKKVVKLPFKYLGLCKSVAIYERRNLFYCFNLI